MQDPTTLPLRRWSREFVDPAVEAQFRVDRMVAQGRRLSTLCVIVAVFFVSFSLTDLDAMGVRPAWVLLLVCRLAVGTATVVLAVRFRRNPAWFASTTGSAVLTTVEFLTLGVVVLASAYRPLEASTHNLSAAFVALAIVLFVPGPYSHKSVLIGAFYLVFFVVATTIFVDPGMKPVTLALNFVSAYGFVLFCMANLHHAERRSWLVLAEERHANDRLQAEIRRAEELQVELARLASQDELTGLANRRSFLERGRRLLDAMTHDDGQQVSVILLDADSFKSINDRFGHAIGDEAIQAIAGALRSVLRHDEIVGRIGGEEFAVVVRGPDADHASTIASRLRSAVESTPILAGEHLIGVTVSVGVVACTVGTSLADALRQADEAMYDAKRAGGNRVSLV